MNYKKILLLLLVALCATFTISAQKLTVESLVQTNDAIARSRNVKGTDGNVCAAVVVRIPSSNATFDGGFIIGKPAYKNGEYIIDMQTGAAQMRVSVPGYNTIDVKFRDYLDSTLQSKTTYLLTINMPQSDAQQKMQTLNIKVTPNDAIVLIDGEVVDGNTVELTVGTHKYSVAARGFYAQEGTVEVKEISPAKLLIELDCKQTATPSSPSPAVVSQPVQQVVSTPVQTANAEDIYNKGKEYYNEKNYTEAVKLYKQAADMDYAKAQCDLGYCYCDGEGVAQDYSQAVYWYRKAADQGDALGQSNLAYCYYSGQGVTQDYGQAVYWYRKAGDQGDADAQFVLGVCYLDGQGVTQDYSQAVYWYRKAAHQGHADALCNLGSCYYNGQGVTQDYSQAVYWYRKAADQGHAIAQCFLAYCYEDGYGITQDYHQAAYWYRKAADQGVAVAQFNLAQRYYYGNGVAIDKKQAKAWYEKAAAQGVEEAKKKLRELTFD